MWCFKGIYVYGWLPTFTKYGSVSDKRPIYLDPPSDIRLEDLDLHSSDPRVVF